MFVYPLEAIGSERVKQESGFIGNKKMKNL